jgi:putative CocE/NonD family hydrolase
MNPLKPSSYAGPPRGEISEERFSEVEVVHDLRVPMRDGVEMALDLVRPRGCEEPLPVLLGRTPYDKVIDREWDPERYARLARRGYIVALSDCRGRFNSDGVFVPMVDEHADGHDTVEWIGEQSWCDGNVGMLGGSYGGWTQWYAASEAPRHLKAIVPYVSPPPSPWRNEPIQNGIYRLCYSEWMVVMGQRSWRVDGWAKEAFTKQQDYFKALPVGDVDKAANVESDWWREFIQHPNYDDFWRRASYGPYNKIRVPALNVSGWWDMNFPGSPENFEGMRREGATPESQIGQKLVIGPWAHYPNGETLSGVDFGEQALIELEEYVLRFLDRWLKGTENGIEDEDPVYVFVLNANEWRAEKNWPIPGTEEVPFYFHSGGQANSLLGDGVLSTEEPATEEPPDRYEYDPENVGETLWYLQGGPVDDRLATAREDVLCYTTEALTEPLEVIGWVTCQLYAASSALDTDWHARLVDVDPDGVARFLCHGMLRARFRESMEKPKLLEPNEPTLFEFSMDATGIRFPVGHRIRIEIASAWFTQWARNLNTGAENHWQEADPVIAQQTVFHQPGLASRVVLPVVPPAAES